MILEYKHKQVAWLLITAFVPVEVQALAAGLGLAFTPFTHHSGLLASFVLACCGDACKDTDMFNMRHTGTKYYPERCLVILLIQKGLHWSGSVGEALSCWHSKVGCCWENVWEQEQISTMGIRDVARLQHQQLRDGCQLPACQYPSLDQLQSVGPWWRRACTGFWLQWISQNQKLLTDYARLKTKIKTFWNYISSHESHEPICSTC